MSKISKNKLKTFLFLKLVFSINLFVDSSAKILASENIYSSSILITVVIIVIQSCESSITNSPKSCQDGGFKIQNVSWVLLRTYAKNLRRWI